MGSTASLEAVLDQNGYTAPTLHWYLNYCCRDDYGTRYDKVSAWAGLHYYCSRWGTGGQRRQRRLADLAGRDGTGGEGDGGKIRYRAAWRGRWCR